MKKVIIAFLLIMGLLTSCTPANQKPAYESSPAVLDLHMDCIEQLQSDNVLEIGNAVFNNAWAKSAFVESYIKLTDSGTFDIYIRLKYNNDLLEMDQWYYVKVVDKAVIKAEKADNIKTTITTLLGYKYTDKIDKRWEVKKNES